MFDEPDGWGDGDDRDGCLGVVWAGGLIAVAAGLVGIAWCAVRAGIIAACGP